MPRKPRGKISGAQPGNRNALKTGLHTAKIRTQRLAVRQLIRQMNATIALANSVAPNPALVHPVDQDREQ